MVSKDKDVSNPFMTIIGSSIIGASRFYRSSFWRINSTGLTCLRFSSPLDERDDQCVKVTKSWPK